MGDLLSPRHLLLILLIVLLVFGTRKLKTIGSDLGAAVRGFKKSMNDNESDSHSTEVTKQISPPDTQKPG